MSGWSADDGVCLFVMRGCSRSEAVKMPVVIPHQLASGSTLSDTLGSEVHVEEYSLQKQRNMLFQNQRNIPQCNESVASEIWSGSAVLTNSSLLNLSQNTRNGYNGYVPIYQSNMQ